MTGPRKENLKDVTRAHFFASLQCQKCNTKNEFKVKANIAAKYVVPQYIVNGG